MSAKDRQKKIALVELHRHSEVLRSLALLLLEGGWELAVFTHQAVQEDLYELEDLPGVHWYLRGKQKSVDFLNQHQSVFQDCSFIIWVTLFTEPSLLKQTGFQSKSILLIHNVHTFFAPYDHISLRNTFPQVLADLYRLARFWVLREAVARWQLLQKVSYLSLASPQLLRTLQESQADLWKQYRFLDPPLPFAFFEGIPAEVESEKEEISIVIPGTVSTEGKDYEMVLWAFRQLVPELSVKVKLTLLGQAKSRAARQLVAAFQEIQNPFFTFLYFKQVLPQRAFDAHLRSSDFLLLPLRPSYQLGIIREIYGQSNISGGINDLIRFGIPALLPVHYRRPWPLRQLTATYSTSDDFLILLKKWINQKHYTSLRHKAPESLTDYEKERLVQEVDRQLTHLLSQ